MEHKKALGLVKRLVAYTNFLKGALSEQVGKIKTG